MAFSHTYFKSSVIKVMYYFIFVRRFSDSGGVELNQDILLHSGFRIRITSGTKRVLGNLQLVQIIYAEDERQIWERAM